MSTERTAENDARTHGNNHAPLLNDALLDPGYCDGCDRERLREQLDEAIAKWEDRGPTSLTVALLAEAAYAARRALETSLLPPGGCGICGKPLSEVGTSRCYEAHGVLPPSSADESETR